MHPARTTYIEAFFVSHYADIEIEVQSVLAADWHFYLAAFPQAKYGWSFPVGADISDWGVLTRGVVWIVCPQLVSHHLERFDNGTVQTYIEAIVWLVDRYIDHFGIDSFLTHPDPIPFPVMEQLLADFENTLYDLSPPALSVYSRVQLSVLDP